MCQGIEATLMGSMLSGGLKEDALICHYCWAVFSISAIVAAVAFLLIAGEIITQLRGATNQQQQQNPEPQSMRENLALYISRLRELWNWNDTLIILLCTVFCGLVLSMSYALPGTLPLHLESPFFWDRDLEGEEFSPVPPLSLNTHGRFRDALLFGDGLGAPGQGQHVQGIPRSLPSISGTFSISKSNTYQLLKPQFDIALFEIIFPLIFLNCNDEISGVKTLMNMSGKVMRFVSFVRKKFVSYDGAAQCYKPYRQKDDALLAIGALCDKMKWTEPYKPQIEQMLVEHVFPEIKNQVSHLREKDRSGIPVN
ncbi:hypothetical protein SUGI_0541560 [Cryptomeria japonica]|nr:hypothetical protein SUGI_0541560 [Cryptomeria japonica]